MTMNKHTLLPSHSRALSTPTALKPLECEPQGMNTQARYRYCLLLKSRYCCTGTAEQRMEYFTRVCQAYRHSAMKWRSTSLAPWQELDDSIGKVLLQRIAGDIVDAQPGSRSRLPLQSFAQVVVSVRHKARILVGPYPPG